MRKNPEERAYLSKTVARPETGIHSCEVTSSDALQIFHRATSSKGMGASRFAYFGMSRRRGFIFEPFNHACPPRRRSETKLLQSHFETRPTSASVWWSRHSEITRRYSQKRDVISRTAFYDSSE